MHRTLDGSRIGGVLPQATYLAAALVMGAAVLQGTLNLRLGQPWIAAAVGLLAGLLTYAAVKRNFRPGLSLPDKHFTQLAWSLIVFTFLFRLSFLGLINLIPEEAYYWKYAENLDYGYLDHPPWVALTIYLGEFLAGTSEAGVRIGAPLWWLVAGFFIYQLSVLMFNRKAALGALVLWSTLPFYFAVGFFISPDAPLVAFWAASIYFLYRVFVSGREGLWWAAGVCLGLGMLAKYPIALLAPAILVFMLVDPAARRQFLSPRPYLAAAAALLCFSPVLFWNIEHDWASFAFQSVERLQKETDFSFPSLLAFMLLTLMPTGMIVFGMALGRGWRALRRREKPVGSLSCLDLSPTAARFVAVFVLTPLLVFAIFSLTKAVKVNWLGPVFIPFLPVLGASLAEVFEGKTLFANRMRRGWLAVFALEFFGFALFFLYLGVQIPALPYSPKLHKFMAGRDLARELLQRERASAAANNSPAVVVGMDKHYIASQLGFYRAVLSRDHRPEATVGRHLFGRGSLMHRFWANPADFSGRNMILAARSPDDLADRIVAPFFKKVGPLKSITTERNGYKSYELFYREGESYTPR